MGLNYFLSENEYFNNAAISEGSFGINVKKGCLRNGLNSLLEIKNDLLQIIISWKFFKLKMTQNSTKCFYDEWSN